MPRLEATLLDRFVNGAFAGKRKIGRPLKYNIRHKGHQGWIELCFNPRTRLEQYISEAMRFIHPYLFFVTYRFHVEKAREAGKLIYNKLKRMPMLGFDSFDPSLTSYGYGVIRQTRFCALC